MCKYFNSSVRFHAVPAYLLVEGKIRFRVEKTFIRTLTPMVEDIEMYQMLAQFGAGYTPLFGYGAYKFASGKPVEPEAFMKDEELFRLLGLLED